MNFKKYFIKIVSPLICAALLMSDGGNVYAVFGSTYFDTEEISVNIDTASGHKAISPYIYGISAETDLSGLTVNALRQSDPRVSSYNWETNFVNSASGEDSENSSDLVSSAIQGGQRRPALYTEELVARAKQYGISSRYVTLQMMGFAAADQAGALYPSDGTSRWKKVAFNKRDALLSKPDVNDDTVYMDEYASFLANRYGYAVDGGINGYFLDNEPENWKERYPSAVSKQITADGLIERSAELAETVKQIDPTALVYGPSINGIEAFINLKNPEDWEQHGQEYSWFIDYYLMQMKNASEAADTRLLDVLDIHYHTEATNGLLEPIINNTDNFSNNTRLQAPRILWDSSYTENSAIAIMHNQHIPLIPTLEASINMYYPGTKLSFSEYNFGGGGHISGGIAVADTLGIFASYGVHMACLKPNSEDISYQKSGINIYTDYDGGGGSFGNTLVRSDNGGDAMSSVYAAVKDADESALKAVMINKNQSSVKTAEVTIRSAVDFEKASVYSFNEESAEIVLSDSEIVIKNNSFVFDMEPLTVYMLVFEGEEADITADNEQSVTTVEEDGGSEPEESSSGLPSTEDSSETVSETKPEHVDAETYSSAGTSAEEETYLSSEQASESAASVPNEDDGSGERNASEAETSESAPEQVGDEKTVPTPLKVIVCALVGAVLLAIGYVILSDILMNRKK